MICGKICTAGKNFTLAPAVTGLTNFTYVPKTAPSNFLNCDFNVLFSEYPNCPPFISLCTGHLVLADHQGHLDCATAYIIMQCIIQVSSNVIMGTGGANSVKRIPADF